MFTAVFLKATLERMVRGAVVSVSAAFFGGDLIFDALNVNTWRDVLALAVTGAFTSLLLSITGQAITGNGPSLTNSEVTNPPEPPPAAD